MASGNHVCKPSCADFATTSYKQEDANKKEGIYTKIAKNHKGF